MTQIPIKALKPRKFPVMVYLDSEEKEKLEGLKKQLSRNGIVISGSSVLKICLREFEV